VDADLTRLRVATALAHEAGAFARRRFAERPATLELTFKGRQDYLSETDAEVEAMLRQGFAASFPEDSFFGEEDGGSLEGDAWVVDPIDGTSNFVRGIPHFCISIAHVAAGRVSVGVIYDPVRDELFAAARGRGATLNGRPLKVSGLDDLAVATVEAGWSTRLSNERWLALVAGLMAEGASVRRGGSGALGLAYVAAGRNDAYCELHINAWDALAGLLLIEEAGGRTCDFLAGDGLAKGNPVLGATPGVAAAVGRIAGIAI
jgi:myo-inositol-1(or 4)-monophosphatase